MSKDLEALVLRLSIIATDTDEWKQWRLTNEDKDVVIDRTENRISELIADLRRQLAAAEALCQTAADVLNEYASKEFYMGSGGGYRHYHVVTKTITALRSVANTVTLQPAQAPATGNTQPLIELWQAWCNDDDADDDDLFSEWIERHYSDNDEALRAMFRNLEHSTSTLPPPADDKRTGGE